MIEDTKTHRGDTICCKGYGVGGYNVEQGSNGLLVPEIEPCTVFLEEYYFLLSNTHKEAPRRTSVGGYNVLMLS